MATITIPLTDEQLARLRQHAVASRRSLAEVVREAVDAYLAQLPRNGASPPKRGAAPPAPAWEPATRLAADGTRVRIPDGMSPREVEELVSQPSPAARGAFLAAWLRQRGAHVIEPADDIPDEEWQARFDTVIEQIRQAGPTDLSSEEIEREITLARREARRALTSE